LIKVDKSWTLFLDRDGVINDEPPEIYIRSWNEFHFFPTTFEALKKFAELFGRICVVTNQQGVGKGILSEETLHEIHRNMKSEIEDHGGRIDAIYYCPHLESLNCDCRKPKTGMPLNAKKDFPEIDFSKSIMVGDSIRDIEMGKSLGMITMKIKSKEECVADYHFDSLEGFADELISGEKQ